MHELCRCMFELCSCSVCVRYFVLKEAVLSYYQDEDEVVELWLKERPGVQRDVRRPQAPPA